MIEWQNGMESTGQSLGLPWILFVSRNRTASFWLCLVSSKSNSRVCALYFSLNFILIVEDVL